MMHGHAKSDLVIVAMKPATKAKEAPCGGVCGGGRSGVGGAKGGAKGNTHQQSTYWTQNQARDRYAHRRRFVLVITAQQLRWSPMTRPLLWRNQWRVAEMKITFWPGLLLVAVASTAPLNGAPPAPPFSFLEDSLTGWIGRVCTHGMLRRTSHGSVTQIKPGGFMVRRQFQPSSNFAFSN
jgi:hypothetical protein